VEGLAGLLPFILIALVFWLLLIRPQRKRQLELQRTQRGLEIGDEVMLGAGIVGTVAATDDEFVELEVSPGVHLRVARGAVARVLTPQGYEPDEAVLDTGDDSAVDRPGDPDDPRPAG
jgi:preprotein translocase subunit YajC